MLHYIIHLSICNASCTITMTHVIQHEIKGICATYYHLTAIAFYEEFVQHTDFQSIIVKKIYNVEDAYVFVCLTAPIFLMPGHNQFALGVWEGEILHFR